MAASVPFSTLAMGVIAAPVPTGWEWRESHRISEPGGRLNLIVSTEPTALTLDEYVEAQREVISEFNGFQEMGSADFGLAGREPAPGHLWWFSWLPDQSEPVTQWQLCAIRGGLALVATATSLRVLATEHEHTVRDLLSRVEMRSSAADLVDDRRDRD